MHFAIFKAFYKQLFSIILGLFMRIYFVALCSFAYSFTLVQAMDQSPVLTESHDLFDTFYYPRTSEQLQEFAKSKRQADRDGNLQGLKLLATNPKNACIRSVRELISQELKKENFTEAAQWCHHALHLADKGMTLDPSIALCYAGLLDAADEKKIEPLNTISPFVRESRIDYLLDYAAIPHLLSIPGARRYFYFMFPQARTERDILEKNRYKRLQNIMDASLDTFTQEELDEIKTLHALPSACYFIKKHLSDNSSTKHNFNPALALYHAKSVLDACNAKEYFLQAGVYDLLQNFTQSKKPNKHQLNAALVLAELEDGPRLALSHIKPVIKHLHKMTSSDFPIIAQKTVKFLEDALKEESMDAVVAMKEFLESAGFAHYKKNLVGNGGVGARDFALQLYSYSQRPAFALPDCKAFCAVAKSEAISLLQSAVQQGDARAHWKLLAIKEVDGQDAPMLAQAIEKTKNAHHQEIAGALEQEIMGTFNKEAMQAVKQELNETIKQEITEAIKNVQKCSDTAVMLALADVYANGLQNYIDKNEGQALKYCVLAGQNGIDALIKHFDAITIPETCFFAAVHLHSQRALGESVLKMAEAYLNKARQNSQGNHSLLKMIIKFGIAHAELFNQAMLAMHDLCLKHGQNTSFWQSEKQFVNEIIDSLMKNADTGDIRSSVFLSQVLHDCADLIQHPKISDCKKMAYFYKERAALAGHDLSLLEISSNYEDLIGLPVTDESYQQAAQYWNKVCGVAQKMIDEQEKKKWKELAVSKTRALVKFQHQFVEKKILPDVDPAFYYHCMLTLHETDPDIAVECLSKAESFMIKDENEGDRNLIRLMGISECVERNIALKKGWAYYAKAIIKMCRSCIQTAPTIQAHTQNIKQLKEVQNLTVQARTAPEPYENSCILEDVKIEHLLGSEHTSLAKIAGLDCDLGKNSLETALYYFEKAAKKNCAESAFAWADLCLSQKREQKGQEVFEKAIDYLIQSARKGFKPAINRLDHMYRTGFGVSARCGGTMTSHLYQKIKNEINPQNIEFPEIAKSYELMADTPRAIQLFKNQEYQKAYEIFKKQAEDDTIDALVYMGIMHRDGLFVEKSAELAHAYFIRALTIWDGNEKDCMILNNADESINSITQHDLSAQVARTLYLAGLILALPNARKSDYGPVSRNLLLAEQMACKSKNSHDHTMLFNAPLAQRINSIILGENPPFVFLLDVVSCYAKRISKIGLPSDENHLVQLLNPLLLLTETLAEAVNSAKPIALFKDISDDKIRDTLSSIEAAIRKAPQSTSPSLTYLLGMMHVAAGIEKRSIASVKLGMDFIKQAAEKCVADAKHTHAILQLYGNRLSKDIPFDKKNGLIALEELANSGQINAMVTLGKYYYSDKTENKKNAKKASQFFEQVLAKDPKNHEAAFLNAEIYCQHPTLVNNGYARIYQLFEVASSNEQVGQSARLYQIFLSLTKDPSLINSTTVIQRLLHILERATLAQDDVTCLINALSRARKFDEVLIAWFNDAFATTSTDCQKNEASRAAAMIGWWYMIMAKLKANSQEEWQKDHAKAVEYLKKSIQYCPDIVLAHALMAALYQESCYDCRDLDKSKNEILLACSALGKKKLTLKDEPVLQRVMYEFKKMQNLIRTSDLQRDFSKIISQCEFEKMHNNIELINKLEARYS